MFCSKWIHYRVPAKYQMAGQIEDDIGDIVIVISGGPIYSIKSLKW